MELSFADAVDGLADLSEVGVEGFTEDRHDITESTSEAHSSLPRPR